MVIGTSSFELSRTPNIIFGTGKIMELPELAATFYESILLIVSCSFSKSDSYKILLDKLKSKNIMFYTVVVSGEPSPEIIDRIVGEYGNIKLSAVIGIGGGSTIDCGKAVSAMLPLGESVGDYLEGVGTKTHNGVKIPYIAVPTTSGTGSEATKNAVISRIGQKGFKKSLRHNNFVPDYAVVDPRLTVSCPRESTAACGLDALTQLLESYTSKNSSDITDSLALSGLLKIRDGFEESITNGSNISARENMSYAALLSGITLANAGLGVVHGFASPIGGYFDIPHGVVCGTLLGEATKMNIDVLYEDMKGNRAYIEKYSRAGEVLSGKKAKDPEEGCQILIDTITYWINNSGIKTLDSYGIKETDIDRIIEKTGCKFNPADLQYRHLKSILERRIKNIHNL